MPAMYPFEPDYAVSPGEILEERMNVRGLSPAELARRGGVSESVISGIISGNTPIDLETALLLEKLLDLDSRVWLGIEAAYRSRLARSAERKAVQRAAT